MSFAVAASNSNPACVLIKRETTSEDEGDEAEDAAPRAGAGVGAGTGAQQPDSQSSHVALLLLRKGAARGGSKSSSSSSNSSLPASPPAASAPRVSPPRPSMTATASPTGTPREASLHNPVAAHTYAAAVAAAAAAAADPLAESRTIYKVKRFLFTLIQFGCDISSDTGDRVKELVFSLVAGSMSVLDFHQSLQEVTHLPLRPFVLPFLKANIPLLARDVAALATLTGQTTASYLRSHQHLLLELPTGFHTAEPHDIFHSEASSAALRIKRRCSSETTAAESDDVGTAKRVRPLDASGPPSATPSRRQGMRVHPQTWTPQREQQQQQQEQHGQIQQGEDEWKNIQVMLNCIMGMVDKTKRALSILQQRQTKSGLGPSPALSSASCVEQQQSSSVSVRRHAFAPVAPSTVNELLAATIRSTEERVIEVRRRAEEAVHEVKRAAMAELQRAVAVAERRALESVAEERLKMERLLLMETSARRGGVASASAAAKPEVKQHPAENGASEQANCWNCGRPATETCSGCNVARYCSQFCQHKDWESHHLGCARKKSDLDEGPDGSEDSSSGSSPERTERTSPDSSPVKLRRQHIVSNNNNKAEAVAEAETE